MVEIKCLLSSPGAEQEQVYRLVRVPEVRVHLIKKKKTIIIDKIVMLTKYSVK